MNLPGAIVDLPTLTEQDENDILEFGVKQGVDFIAASFVRKASDVEYIRELLGPKGDYIKIISYTKKRYYVINIIGEGGDAGLRHRARPRSPLVVATDRNHKAANE